MSDVPRPASAATPLDQLLGESPAIEAIREQVSRLLSRQGGALRRLAPILILGETGTGKGLVAGILHRAGPRAAGPFVDVNCAAIPETLLEAELFGYERGAFTDARRAKPGLLQTAHRGMLFLDEVGLLPEALQAKLLKVLEERSVRRLGTRGANRWTCGSCPRPGGSPRRHRRGASRRLNHGSRSDARLPPPGARKRTSAGWPSTFSAVRGHGQPRTPRPTRGRRSRRIPGRGTCGSSRTRWSVWPCSPTRAW
jgi:hypothetical protein